MHPIAPYARTAYAQGWAASGGPMTGRVKAGCIAAVEHAIEHADDPHILEVMLHLGKLEGAWALIYQRREEQHRKHIRKVTDLWRKLITTLPLADAVRRFMQTTGHNLSRDDIAGQATAVARMVFVGTLNPADPDYQAVLDAIAEALRDAQAAGRAGALTIGHLAADFDIAFTQAQDALDDLGLYWADATGWLGRITDGAASDLGRALAAANRDGLDYEDMLAAAMDAIGSSDVRAVATLLDMAMSQALSRGAIALYGSEGVQTVDYWTAGDGRVCAQCARYEEHSPYPLGSAPIPGWHPGCRCVLVPADFGHALTPAPLPASTDT